MTHLNEENLIKTLETAVTEPRWSRIMASVGAVESTAFSWRATCARHRKENFMSSPFWIEWREAYDWWDSHMNRARMENVQIHEATLRAQSLHGIEKVARDSTQSVIYRKNLKYLHRDADWIRLAEGLPIDADVEWYRYEHDSEGLPIPETVRESLPSPLRLAVLRQDKRYLEQSLVDVHHTGEVTVAKPLERQPGDPPSRSIEELRALAALSPAERRRVLGTHPHPLNEHGQRDIPRLPAPINRDAPDDQNRGLRPAAEFQRPPQPKPAREAPRQSYARPSQSLDQSGRGEGVPPSGGGRADAPGNVRR